MGGAVSKVESETVNRVLTDFLINSAKECSAGTANEIILRVSDVAGDVIIEGARFVQKSVVDFGCIQKSFSTGELQTKLATFLSQQASAKGNPYSLPWGKAEINIKQSLYNEIVSEINVEDLQKCAASASNVVEQIFERIGGKLIIKDMTVEQYNQLVSNCDQMSQLALGVTNSINNKLEQRGEAAQMGLVESIFGDFTQYIPYVLGIIVFGIVAAVIIAAITRAGGKKSATTTTPRSPRPSVPRAPPAGGFNAQRWRPRKR